MPVPAAPPLICPISGSGDYRALCEQNGHRWIQFPASGFARLATMPDDAHNATISDAALTDGYIATYRAKFASKFRRSARRARYLRKHMGAGRRVLDVGANIGFFVESCRLLGLQARGIDINEGLVREARRCFPQCDFSATALEEFAPDDHYDAIYCSEVIEHVVDPAAFASRLFGLLNQGGILYLTTPSLNEYLSGDTVKRDLGAPDHKLYFNRRNIVAFLTKTGFAKIRHKLALGGGIQLIAWK
jgi:2-polyprenyl-3-methyl-5-hydroxy-6-metoxy-1,4-benzoquinol methylase